MKLLLLAMVAGYAAAECANGCSGHGFCGVQDKCSCFRNYQGNDCSMRTCPFDIAYVDLPLGDLDMSGALDPEPVSLGSHTNVIYGHETWPTDPAALRSFSNMYDQSEDGHFYAECSNKGTCDRKSGTCDCMDGFEGTACRRTVCPENCSGHGTCETMQAMAENRMTKGASAKYCEGGAYSPKTVSGSFHTTGAQYTNDDLTHLCATEYTLWDRYKAQVCRCDPGYFGLDCSARHCPHGDDPLTTGQLDETQWVDIYASGALTGSFRLTFEDEFGETWDTMPISYSAITAENGYAANSGFNFNSPGVGHADNIALAGRVEAALEGIPNGTIQDVTVTVDVADQPLPGVITARDDGVTPMTISVDTSNNKLGRGLSLHATSNGAALVGVNSVAPAGKTYYITNCKSDANLAVADLTNADAVAAVEASADLFTYTTTAAADATEFAVAKPHCRAYRYGFRLKVDFHKNPGDIHTLGVDFSGTTTGDGAAAHYTSGDILRFVGPVGHGASGSATASTIFLPTLFDQHIAVGDRIMIPGKTASDAADAVTDLVQIFTVATVGALDSADASATSVTMTINETVGFDTDLEAKVMNNVRDFNRVWGLYGRGTTENVECSHRGLCNHDDGLCECFAGYTNDDCGTQNALNA